MREDAPTIQHLALHLAKDMGKLAEAAEKLDHKESPAEQEEGRRRLREFLDRRIPQVLQTVALLRRSIQAALGAGAPHGPPGLYEKYLLTKADGSPLDEGAGYVTFRMDNDPHSWAAALAYAASVEEENPTFARDLRRWVADARAHRPDLAEKQARSGVRLVEPHVRGCEGAARVERDGGTRWLLHESAPVLVRDFRGRRHLNAARTWLQFRCRDGRCDARLIVRADRAEQVADTLARPAQEVPDRG